MYLVTDLSPFFFDNDGVIVAYPENPEGMIPVESKLQETIELHVFPNEVAAVAFAEGIEWMREMADLQDGPKLDPGTFPMLGQDWPCVYVAYPAANQDQIAITIVNHD